MRILLVGSGKTAYFLARRFQKEGLGVTVVVDDTEEARRLGRALDGVPVVIGDGARPEVLDDAGALQAEALVAFTAEDHRNLVACQVARRVFSVRRTIAMVNDPENREVFQRLGVDATVSVTELLGGLLARETVFETLRGHEAFGDGRILVSEVELAPSSPASGARLADLGSLPGLVAAVLRGATAEVARGDTRLEPGDRLVVMSAPDRHDDLLERLAGHARR
ncbi:MAG: Trk system potassium uptake protein TrkA [Gemmatimonadota bacterium]